MALLKKIGAAAARYLRETDLLLLVCCLLASAYGLLLVYSAVHGAGNSTFYMQAILTVLGIIIALVVTKWHYESISRLWYIWAGAAVLLVILTLTPLGHAVAGQNAWLVFSIGGRSFSFQPTEILKLAFIITFSRHLSLVQDTLQKPLTVLLLVLHGAAPIVLVFLQGDNGTALIFILVFLIMMFAAGIKPLYVIIGVVCIGVLVPFAWQVLGESLRLRILSLFNPGLYPDVAYQQNYGLLALGSGGLWGMGFLQGLQTTLFARDNDFIFTVAGEEFGFVGSLLVIALLLLVLVAIYRTAYRTKDRQGSLLCTGVFAMLMFQSLLNIGMVLRLMPVIGITLPFFSAGGSSVLTVYLGIGLVLSVHARMREQTDTIFHRYS